MATKPKTKRKKVYVVADSSAVVHIGFRVDEAVDVLPACSRIKHPSNAEIFEIGADELEEAYGLDPDDEEDRCESCEFRTSFSEEGEKR